MKIKLSLLLFVVVLLSCNPKKVETDKVTVAVAANMQYAMNDVGKAFFERYKIEVEIASSSSGTLTTQIKQGAPFDLFISANMRYPNILYRDGFALEKPEVYAYGKLVLWTLRDINIEKGLQALMNNNVRSIAIANPEIAPYGMAGFEALNSLNLQSKIKQKLIIGESIGQVNQYITSYAVDIGLTSKSVLFSPKINNKGKSVEINQNFYSPIYQGIVMLKKGKEENLKNSQLFYDFMFSKEVKTILTAFGYHVNL